MVAPTQYFLQNRIVAINITECFPVTLHRLSAKEYHQNRLAAAATGLAEAEKSHVPHMMTSPMRSVTLIPLSNRGAPSGNHGAPRPRDKAGIPNSATLQGTIAAVYCTDFVCAEKTSNIEKGFNHRIVNPQNTIFPQYSTGVYRFKDGPTICEITIVMFFVLRHIFVSRQRQFFLRVLLTSTQGALRYITAYARGDHQKSSVARVIDGSKSPRPGSSFAGRPSGRHKHQELLNTIVWKPALPNTESRGTANRENNGLI